jgi:hypothetical protein
VDPIAEGLGEPSAVLLDQQEWKDSRELEAVLNPVAELSHFIQGSKCTTANIGLPLLQLLKQQLNSDTIEVKGSGTSSKSASLPCNQLGTLSSAAQKILLEQ